MDQDPKSMFSIRYVVYTIPILNIKTDRLKVKEQVNGAKYTILTLKKKKSWNSSIISDKADFRARKIIRVSKEWHYITIKESILQEDLTILNVYVLDNRPSKYTRQKTEQQGEID